MRGPGSRVKYDVRRLWHCPKCGYERHAPATEVAVRCHCNADEPWMKLVESQRHVRPETPPHDPYVELEDLEAQNGDSTDVSEQVTESTKHNQDDPPVDNQQEPEDGNREPAEEATSSADTSISTAAAPEEPATPETVLDDEHGADHA